MAAEKPNPVVESTVCDSAARGLPSARADRLAIPLRDEVNSIELRSLIPQMRWVFLDLPRSCPPVNRRPIYPPTTPGDRPGGGLIGAPVTS